MTIESQKLFIPALAGFYRCVSPLGYALMRFATGAILVPHGVQKVLYRSVATYGQTIASKGLPFADVLAYLVFFTESVAAACLAIGLFTRVAAAMVGIQMLVIVLVFQWQYGYFWTDKGYEFALLWTVLCIGIFFHGGGRYSVDHLIGREF